MTVATAAPPAAPAPADTVAGVTDRPWYLYAVLFASTSVMTGVIWDISWHMSIGRDSFWTPAHLAIYAGGVVAGLACGYLALRTTFAGTAADKAHTVRFWRYFHALLGAWVCIWGAFAMITSGPFDDWWHNAYGLDVEILSPPHVLLALGIITIQIGAMLMVLAQQNRADGTARARVSRWMYAYAAGILLVMIGTMASEYTEPNQWHHLRTYKILAGLLPLFLFATARASRLRWPMTTIAAFYWLAISAIGWILQLFPAEPMLAPIYNPITHMVAPRVPLLLVVPAFGTDLLLQRWGNRSDWLLAPVAALVFLALLIGTHWVWGEFILSPAARNFFFMADQWSYGARPGEWQYTFWNVERDPIWQPAGLAFAVVLATISTRAGLWWGNWMRRVRR